MTTEGVVGRRSDTFAVVVFVVVALHACEMGWMDKVRERWKKCVFWNRVMALTREWEGIVGIEVVSW